MEKINTDCKRRKSKTKTYKQTVGKKNKRATHQERNQRKTGHVKCHAQGQIYLSIFSKSNRGYCVYYPSNLFRKARRFENWGIFNNYSPKWRWLAVDIYRAAKRRGKYQPLATDTEVNSCFSIY